MSFDPLADPGVVTIAGDWHGDLELATKIVEDAPVGPDGKRTILQLGDLGLWPGAGVDGFVDLLDTLLAERNAVVLFIDGNHDDHRELRERPPASEGPQEIRSRVFYLPRAFRWSWHGSSWLALGGAYTISRAKRTEGIDWWPQEMLDAGDVEAAIAGGPVDVLVAHDCPAGIAIPGIRDPGPGQPKELFDALVIEAEHRQLVREVVEAVTPKRLFHGHYHVRHQVELRLTDGSNCAVDGLSDGSDPNANAIILDRLAELRGARP